jgi:biotin carboxyl carrier protein
LVILEAMKMQNEILSPARGLVKAVHVEKGQTVLGDEPMVVLSIGS